MKKIILMCILSAAIGGCSSRAKRVYVSESNNQLEVAVTTDIKAQETVSAIDIDKMVEDMLTDMYNNTQYENHEWLKSHCTRRCLEYLQEEFYYDCEEGPCYALWKFCTSNDDGYTDEHRMISVENIGDGYYDYTFIDKGFKGVNRVKIVLIKDNLLIDEIINIEEETFE